MTDRELKIILYVIGILITALACGYHIIPLAIGMLISPIFGILLGEEVTR